MTTNTTLLNLRSLKCPLPALKTRKALGTLLAGDRLVVECTDPMAAIDIPHLVTQTGDLLVEQTREEDVLRFVIERVARAKDKTP